MLNPILQGQQSHYGWLGLEYDTDHHYRALKLRDSNTGSRGISRKQGLHPVAGRRRARRFSLVTGRPAKSGSCKGFATANGLARPSRLPTFVSMKGLRCTYTAFSPAAAIWSIVRRTIPDLRGVGARQLQTMLQSPKVLFCRAFISEQAAPVQDVTCYGYYNYPGAMDTVDNLEEQLLSLGAVRLTKKADGSFERPDLTGSSGNRPERVPTACGADPRVKAQ